MNTTEKTETPAIEAKHTPTPWTYSYNPLAKMAYVHTGNPDDTAVVSRHYVTTVNEANAAYIVRACNAHEALVAALELIDKRATSASGATAMRELEHVMGLARAALAEAKAGQ